MSSKPNSLKTVLTVEDEPDVFALIEVLFEPYSDQICLMHAGTAKDAMDILNSPSAYVDAIILDIMLPYGDPETRKQLGGEGDEADIETGIRLLEFIRNKNVKTGNYPVWINVITGRNAPGTLMRLEELLNGNGRLMLKPFNDFELENDLTVLLKIEQSETEIILPEDYESPDEIRTRHET